MMHVVVHAVPTDAQTLRGAERVEDLRIRARAAALESAVHAELPEPSFFQDTEGRPLPLDGVYWSIAHKRGMVAGVVARAPVGLDIESLGPLRDDARAFTDLVMSEEEAEMLSSSAKVPALYRAWTAKEALLKERGVGLSELSAAKIVWASEASVEVAHRGTRRLLSFAYPEEHVVAVTALPDSVVFHGPGLDADAARPVAEARHAV